MSGTTSCFTDDVCFDENWVSDLEITQSTCKLQWQKNLIGTKMETSSVTKKKVKVQTAQTIPMFLVKFSTQRDPRM